ADGRSLFCQRHLHWVSVAGNNPGGKDRSVHCFVRVISSMRLASPITDAKQSAPAVAPTKRPDPLKKPNTPPMSAKVPAARATGRRSSLVHLAPAMASAVVFRQNYSRVGLRPRRVRS